MPLPRLALIGCGFFAANHLAAWKELGDRCDLVAVCDLDPAKAAGAAQRFAVPAHFTDVESILREVKPDFVDIVTTVDSHRPLVELCARYRIAAIVQKPFARDLADAGTMVAAMQAADRPLMVHENFRFQRPLSRAREVLQSGEIGEPIWGRFSWRTNFDVYKGQPNLAEARRFILMDIGVHVLDVARAFMGEATGVSCRTQTIRQGIAGEDMATVLLAHQNGATSLCDFTYESRQTPDPFPQTLIHVEGRRGSIVVTADRRMTVTSPAGSRIEDVSPKPLAWGAEPWLLVQESVVNTQRHWLDCWQTGTAPETSGADNLKTFALVEAAYAAAASGCMESPALT
jgi:predicted dehydrogenase